MAPTILRYPADPLYTHAEAYDLAYRWGRGRECRFIEGCFRRFARRGVRSVLDIACGSGQHLIGLARRGYRVAGIDLSPAMVHFVQGQARRLALPIRLFRQPMQAFSIPGRFDAAICMMDSFRYLVTLEEILWHLRCVARHLRRGGLYLVDFWMPLDWSSLARFKADWEQREDGLTVKVAYRQYPKTGDALRQTVQDRLELLVRRGAKQWHLGGQLMETRVIFPQEWQAIIQASRRFEFVEWFSDFDFRCRLTLTHWNWRVISVLRRI